MIKQFFMPIGGGYMGEIEYWLANGFSLAGSPTVTPGGALLWTLVGPKEASVG